MNFKGVVVGVLLLFGCSSDPLKPQPARSLLQVGSADGTPGWLLDEPLSVRLTDEGGTAVPGETVQWSVAENGAWLEATSSVTDASGIASIAFVPGWRVGTQKVRAESGELHAEVEVTVESAKYTRIATVYGAVCGIDTQGALWCWRPSSRFPTSAPINLPDRYRPVAVDPGTEFVDVAFVNAPESKGFCATTADWELRCHAFDQAWFDGSPVSSIATTSSPYGSPPKLAGLSAADASGPPGVLCGHLAGESWCAGWNNVGTLGDGTTTSRNHFEPIAGERRFHQLVGSAATFCGLDDDDHAWCWGGNLGIAAVATPQRMGGDIEFRSLALAYRSACGIEAATDKLWCWGQGGMAGVERPGTLNPDPIAIAGGENLSQVVSGVNSEFAVFLFNDGVVGFAGDMVHDPGFHKFVRQPVTAPLEGDVSDWRVEWQGYQSIVSTGGDYWCGRHTGGATLCANRVKATVGLPLPR